MCGIFAFRGEASSSEIARAFSRIQHRGPDESRILALKPTLSIGFHRLAIMDLSPQGMQPFVDPNTGDALVCNGEIYNHKDLREYLDGHSFESDSDCEIILPLIHKFGFEEAIQMLDGEFALIYYNAAEDSLYAARDPLGVRPLFFAKSEDGGLGLASEVKALHELFSYVQIFPPAHIYSEIDGLERYTSLTDVHSQTSAPLSDILGNIRYKLTSAITKRLSADAPIGFLLSGGVDSSLVCGVAAKVLGRPIETFAVGCSIDAIDMRYARMVASHIGSKHHEVYFTLTEALSAIDDVIYTLESWDTTTVRASIGMYLVCKYIREKTDVRCLLSGEVSDELFGYKYTDFAPNAAEFQNESIQRVEELHCYDVLRADRCISRHGIEARVPFSDPSFIREVLSIEPELKLNRYGIGKFLLRKAFEGDYLIPHEILFREKAAFSDGVGHSVVDGIKDMVEALISDKELAKASSGFPYQTPRTKEALYYRRIFTKHFPGHEALIPGYWLPNPKWPQCQVIDPSARVLPNYGASGH